MGSFFTVEILHKFLKFGVVGFSGVIVDFGFTFLFRNILKINQYVANAIGFTIAATSNYFLNRVWTFESNNPKVLIEFSEFFLISLIGLGINSLILWLLVSKFKMKFYFAKVFAIAITTLWNFVANVLFTFN